MLQKLFKGGNYSRAKRGNAVCKRLQVNTCLLYLDDVISIIDCAEGTYLIFVRSRAVGRSENMRGDGVVISNPRSFEGESFAYIRATI